jgi:lysine-N-methylase
MTLPLYSLPVVQNWDCHGCTDCCRQYAVRLTPEEQARIAAQGWDQDPEMAGVQLFVREGWLLNKQTYLNHHGVGGCVFLNEQGRCRIHAKFGEQAKPLACRLYPFVLVPAGSALRVGVRFACPSVTENRGVPLREHTAALQAQADAFIQQIGWTEPLDPPPLAGSQRVDWPDLFIFVRALRDILSNERMPVEMCLRKTLALSKLCRQARFERVSGPRLTEFLEVVSASLDVDLAKANTLPPPTRLGRLLFRQTAAICIRKDGGPDRGLAAKGRWALLGAAVRFVLGVGQVPALHRLIPPVRFADLEEADPDWNEECEAMLRRYFRVKLESLQFCGPTNFRLSFWDGWDMLLLMYPLIRWLTRALRRLPNTDTLSALQRSVRIVDDNFGFHPHLGTLRQRFAVRILSDRGDLERLIAWYARVARSE